MIFGEEQLASLLEQIRQRARQIDATLAAQAIEEGRQRLRPWRPGDGVPRFERWRRRLRRRRRARRRH